jgi:hypothetical protein
MNRVQKLGGVALLTVLNAMAGAQTVKANDDCLKCGQAHHVWCTWGTGCDGYEPCYPEGPPCGYYLVTYCDPPPGGQHGFWDCVDGSVDTPCLDGVFQCS